MLIKVDRLVDYMSQDEPFFSSGSYDSYTEVHPEIDSLQIEAELVDIVGDSLRTYYFDEDSLPSHVDCENCGQRLQLGWAIEEAIQSGDEEIDEYVSCSGEEYEGRSCVYGLDIEGSVSYNEEANGDDEE